MVNRKHFGKRKLSRRIQVSELHYSEKIPCQNRQTKACTRYTPKHPHFGNSSFVKRMRVEQNQVNQDRSSLHLRTVKSLCKYQHTFDRFLHSKQACNWAEQPPKRHAACRSTHHCAIADSASILCAFRRTIWFKGE